MRRRSALIASATLLAGLVGRAASAQGCSHDGRFDRWAGDLTYDSRSYGRPADDLRRGDPRDLDDRRRGGDPRGTREEADARRPCLSRDRGPPERP